MDILGQAWDYARQHSEEFWQATIQHLQLSLVALAIAALICIPLGIFTSRFGAIARVIINVVGVARVIPSEVRNSSNRLAPKNASRITRNAHASERILTVAVIEQFRSMPAVLACDDRAGTSDFSALNDFLIFSAAAERIQTLSVAERTTVTSRFIALYTSNEFENNPSLRSRYVPSMPHFRGRRRPGSIEKFSRALPGGCRFRFPGATTRLRSHWQWRQARRWFRPRPSP